MFERVLYKNRDIVIKLDNPALISNATVTELSEDKLNIKGTLEQTVYIKEGFPYTRFVTILDKNVRDKILFEISEYNSIGGQKPKIFNHIFVEESGIIFKIVKFLIEGLSFNLIKIPEHLSFVPKMKAGYYITGHTNPVDMNINGEEYNKVTFVENAKITFKNIT